MMGIKAIDAIRMCLSYYGLSKSLTENNKTWAMALVPSDSDQHRRIIQQRLKRRIINWLWAVAPDRSSRYLPTSWALLEQ